jgi:thiol-disulfide isomerase/thioredoxin
LTEVEIYFRIILKSSLEEMDIKSRVFLSLMIAGIAVFPFAVLYAKDQPLPAMKNASMCESFGIQRFEEKKEAAPFTLNDLNGNQVSLSDFKGKPVILFFWASWCSSCKEDIALIEKFFEGKSDQFSILTIVIDGERKKRVKRLVQQYKITLPVLLVLKEKILDHYAISGWVPVVIFIDAEGRIVGKTVGQRNWSSPEAWAAVKEIFSLH